jgi:beta-glucosidase
VQLSLSLPSPVAYAAESPILADFESGIPAGFGPYSDAFDGSGSATTVEIATVAGDLPVAPAVGGNMILSTTYDIVTSGSWGGGPGYGGVNHNFAATQDWSGYDGFAFWYHGGGTGLTFQVEIFDNGADPGSAERFDYYFTDDFSGWKRFEILFTDFSRATDWQPGGAPDDGLTLTEMWGYAIVLAPGAGEFYLDDVTLFRSPATIANFESGFPAGFGVYSDAIDGSGSSTVVEATTDLADLPRIPVLSGNSAVSVTFDIATSGSWGGGPGYGGLNHNFAAPQDWSEEDGFRFWYYGGNSGLTFQAEIFDNGADPGSAERFDYDLVDDFSGWRLFEIPFTDFSRATDWQPPGAPDDGLTLTGMWGYAIVLAPGAGTFYLDEIATFGQPVLDVKVSYSDSEYEVMEGETASVTVELNMTSSETISVTYGTADGSATAGLDYLPASGTLLFPPGETQQSFLVTTLDNDQDEEDKTVLLSLTDPQNVILGTNDQATLTIVDDEEPTPGNVVLLADFESGLPDGFFSYNGGASGVTATPQVVPPGDPLALPGQAQDNGLLSVSFSISDFGGLGQDFAPNPQDWSDLDGFRFWFYGSNSGLSYQVEIMDNRSDPGADTAERFDVDFVDDFSGWRLIEIPFSDFTRASDWQPPGAPDDGLTLTEMWGYAFVLPLGSASFHVDDIGLLLPQQLVDDFETGLPAGTDTNGTAIGFYTFEGPSSSVALSTTGSPPADVPRIVLPNNVLQMDSDVTSWGGLIHGFENEALDSWVSQDWSAFEGISFWLYGNNSGSGLFFEILDNRNPGATGDDAERWTYPFTDDFAGWRFFNVPFTDFTRKEIGNGAPDDGFTLTEVHGWALGSNSTGGALTYYMDQVALYGKAPEPEPEVEFAKPVYFADEGDSVIVGVTLTYTATDDIEVGVATADGSAIAGSDYTSVDETISFDAGDSPGTTKTFVVETLSDEQAEEAKTVILTLFDASNAIIGANNPINLVINAHDLPYLDPNLPVADRVSDLLSRMSLEEKVGQMTLVERSSLAGSADITAYQLGALLSGGGSAPSPNTPEAWADMIDGFQAWALQTRFQIPLIYGVDAVHGHNNVYGATIFPHNIGLGATRNPDLARQIGVVTAKEVYATGVPWNYSPCLCVARDERWGRTYESFGEDPEIAAMMTTYIDGLQGSDLSAPDTVLATAKHWVADGGTAFGTGDSGYLIDQGIAQMSEQELWTTHIPPYVAAIERNVGSVMPSYSSMDFLDGSEPLKMHASDYLINDILKDQLGFDGFVVSDWQAIDQIPGGYDSDVRTSVNAGVDMVMVPHQYQLFVNTLLAEVNAGNVSQARIDEAVGKILTKKFELGLFEQPYSDRSGIPAIGSADHRAVARQAVRESLVLLKNEDKLLPLAKDAAAIYVAGKNADNVGHQSGGWTIEWQGGSGDITPGTTILEGIQNLVSSETSVTFSIDASAPTDGYDAGIVVVGETPYTEGVGDRADLSLDEADILAIDSVCSAMPCVVVLVSGRPMIISDQLPDIDSLVAAWLPGTEGDGLAEVLFGDYNFSGKLPMSWPRDMTQVPINVGDDDYDPLFPYGFGLKYPLEVSIDILPGSDVNPVNPGQRGILPVAILTTDDFDAGNVDPFSLAFGPAGAPITHKNGHLEDVDGDGDIDLLLHFTITDTGIAAGDVYACLVGARWDGDPIEGCSAIVTVPKE